MDRSSTNMNEKVIPDIENDDKGEQLSGESGSVEASLQQTEDITNVVPFGREDSSDSSSSTSSSSNSSSSLSSSTNDSRDNDVPALTADSLSSEVNIGDVNLSMDSSEVEGKRLADLLELSKSSEVQDTKVVFDGDFLDKIYKDHNVDLSSITDESEGESQKVIESSTRSEDLSVGMERSKIETVTVRSGPVTRLMQRLSTAYLQASTRQSYVRVKRLSRAYVHASTSRTVIHLRKLSKEEVDAAGGF